MNVFLKRWRQKGLQIFIYLDDILLVGHSLSLVENQLQLVLQDLAESGMTINDKKRVLLPSQCVHHLGFTINFQKGCLEVPSRKLKSIRKGLGKFATNDKMSCRKVAAILGQVRSFLAAMPFLRAFTDQLVQFTNQSLVHG